MTVNYFMTAVGALHIGAVAFELSRGNKAMALVYLGYCFSAFVLATVGGK